MQGVGDDEWRILPWTNWDASACHSCPVRPRQVESVRTEGCSGTRAAMCLASHMTATPPHLHKGLAEHSSKNTKQT